jgi:hypothetical protein
VGEQHKVFARGWNFAFFPVAQDFDSAPVDQGIPGDQPVSTGGSCTKLREATECYLPQWNLESAVRRRINIH